MESSEPQPIRLMLLILQRAKCWVRHRKLTKNRLKLCWKVRRADLIVGRLCVRLIVKRFCCVMRSCWSRTGIGLLSCCELRPVNRRIMLNMILICSQRVCVSLWRRQNDWINRYYMIQMVVFCTTCFVSHWVSVLDCWRGIFRY